MSLPEYTSYIKECPDSVEELTRKECGYIAETIVLAALTAGGNVILDSAIQDREWFQRYIQKLRGVFPTLKVAMIYVIADVGCILRRVVKRSHETGRQIPEGSILKTLDNIPKSVDALKGKMDYFCKIHNRDEGMEIISAGGWGIFVSTFTQSAFAEKLLKMERLSSNDQEKSSDCAACKKVDCPFRLPERGQKRQIFSVLRSSEDNHRSDDQNFYGQFAHIRATLDYSYHSNYTFERQLLQDASEYPKCTCFLSTRVCVNLLLCLVFVVVNEFLHDAVFTDKNGNECTTPTEPWIVFTAGAMGAGKVSRGWAVARVKCMDRSNAFAELHNEEAC